MNDCLPIPNSEDIDRNGSKCLLPLCNKQVIHLERHLLNAHDLTYGAYLERTKKTDPVSAPTFRDSVATIGTVNESLGTKSPNNGQNDVVVLVPDTPEWKYSNKEKRKQKTSEIKSRKPGKKKKHSIKRNLHKSFAFERKDAREWLRYLAHNTNSYKVRSLLVFLKQHLNRSIADYYYTKLREDVYGHISLSFLEHVYEKRVELLSYFQKRGCYPYEDGKRPDYCLACDKKGGKCVCVKIPPSFYVFCRYRCPAKYDCAKCKKRKDDMSFHNCYDFFFCKKCDEYYRTTK